MSLIDPPEAYTTDAEIDRAEDFALLVSLEAGCPTDRCPSLTLCEVCGGMVCAEHTHGVATCAEVGEHHLRCVDGCEQCTRARALEWADERAGALR